MLAWTSRTCPIPTDAPDPRRTDSRRADLPHEAVAVVGEIGDLAAGIDDAGEQCGVAGQGVGRVGGNPPDCMIFTALKKGAHE